LRIDKKICSNSPLPKGKPMDIPTIKNISKSNFNNIENKLREIGEIKKMRKDNVP